MKNSLSTVNELQKKNKKNFQEMFKVVFIRLKKGKKRERLWKGIPVLENKNVGEMFSLFATAVISFCDFFCLMM